MQDCDAIVCVAAGSAEPALCTLVCDMLAERYGRVVLVANRVGDEDAWSRHAAVAVPESRLAAIVMARGRTPSGAVGAAMFHIAALVEAQK
jgi:hypothetical protein